MIRVSRLIGFFPLQPAHLSKLAYLSKIGRYIGELAYEHKTRKPENQKMEVNAVAIKLPAFWKGEPDLWFA